MPKRFKFISDRPYIAQFRRMEHGHYELVEELPAVEDLVEFISPYCDSAG